MKVFLTGANGFIGSHIASRLLSDGHTVVAAVRDPLKLKRRMPGVEAIRADFNDMTTPERWVPLLHGVDAVVNCAGVLRSSRGQSIDAIHTLAPSALFDACAEAGVRKVVQISAVGVEGETPFARTKQAADQHLKQLDLDWTVLRPSLVYGDGSYGGTSLLRALAACPFLTPVIGTGDQAFNPIHVEDLAATVARCLSSNAFANKIVEPCGPDRLTLVQLARTYRGWLGMKPAPIFKAPRWLTGFVGRLGDVFGTGPITTTALVQMEQADVADPQAFLDTAGFTPRTLDDALQSKPSTSQDLWHARLYLLRAPIRVSLILMWLVSGLVGLVTPPESYAAYIPFRNLALAGALGGAASIADIFIAGALLFHWRPRLTAYVQLSFILGYTVFLTGMAPALWLEPLGPLLKNLPILALVGVSMILDEER